jgi:UDP-N-acetylglucosamine 1-carboxyvinyltransferase
MQRFVVRRSGPLSGTVRLQGAKNSALKLLAASLLVEGTTRLANVPRITDVQIMAELLRALGATVQREESGELAVTCPAELTPIAPYDLVEQIRASIVVLGPLLARRGWARISLPGGDDFGGRPIDFHLRAFEELGAEFSFEHGEVTGRCDQLVGCRIVLEYPSHTTTDNVLMAAVLAKGTTVIENAAREPEVADLAALLCAMGARIDGAGTSRIEIEGVDALHPAHHRVVADRVAAATFLAATGIAGGDVLVEGARAEHMDMLLVKLSAAGLVLEDGPAGIRVRAEGRLRAVDISTLPYPGVATDYKPLLVALLSLAQGVSIVTENLYAGRFRYIDELRRMGAEVTTDGHHVVVRGAERLSGAPVRAPDIRAGAALVLAGLGADGETIVHGAEHVDRGYDDFVGALAGIGADIVRLGDAPAVL